MAVKRSGTMAGQMTSAGRGRMIRSMSRFIAVFTIGLLACTLASSVLAQQRYELSDGQWVAQTPPDPASPEGKLETIRKTIAEGDGEAAVKLADEWIAAYPNHNMLVEAYLLRGDAKVAQRRYWRALYDYEAVIRLYPGSEQYATALEREYEIARLYVTGLKRHFMGMRILDASDDGEELLIRCQERAPGSEIGERASMTLSDYYFDKGDMSQAAEAYDLFLENYPESRQREWAMLRLIQANLARFKGPQFDPTGLLEARQRLADYSEQFPAAAERLGSDALMVRIDESLALEDYVIARWYEKRQLHVSAVYLYRRVIARYPQTGAAQQAQDRLKAMHEPIVEEAAS